ncbi:MAG: hypothetical protein COW12_01110, partial [Candidatus Omnitrophica bacterium CG12_big_fil_rev_8_21_14_0_65_45_16]
MFIPKNIQRAIAFFLAISFSLSNGPTLLLAETYPGSSLPYHASSVNPNAILDSLKLPGELGIVQEVYSAVPGTTVPGSQNPAPAVPGTGIGFKVNQLVILVQNAHANYDSESNVRKIIQFFQEHYQLGLVLLEGGEGKLDPLFFKSFPDGKIKEKLLDQYLKHGDLQGGEAAAILNHSNNPTSYWGIEDETLYQQNKAAFLKAIVQTDQILKQLTQKEAALEENIASLPESSQTFYKAWQAFHADEMNLLEYVKTLAEHTSGTGSVDSVIPARLWRESTVIGALVRSFPELAKLLEVEKGEQALQKSEIDMTVNQLLKEFQSTALPALSVESQKEWGQRIQDYQTGRLGVGFLIKQLESFLTIPDVLKPAIQHAQTISSVRGTEIFHELEHLENAVRDQLPGRERLHQVNELHLLKRFARLEITHEEWKVIASAAKQSQDQGLLRSFHSLAMTEMLKNHFTFYQLALKRDGILSGRILEIMRRESQKVSLVVTGGFHESGIKERLRANGTAYVLISPAIQEVGSNEAYLNAMHDKRSFMKYFQGSYWDALAKDYMQQSSAAAGPQEEKFIFKQWRDQLIQNTLQEGRITQATRYTRYLDSFLQTEGKPADDKVGRKTQLEGAFESFLSTYFKQHQADLNAKLDHFAAGFKNMLTQGTFTQGAVEALLRQTQVLQTAQLAPDLALIPAWNQFHLSEATIETLPDINQPLWLEHKQKSELRSEEVDSDYWYAYGEEFLILMEEVGYRIDETDLEGDITLEVETVSDDRFPKDFSKLAKSVPESDLTRLRDTYIHILKNAIGKSRTLEEIVEGLSTLILRQAGIRLNDRKLIEAITDILLTYKEKGVTGPTLQLRHVYLFPRYGDVNEIIQLLANHRGKRGTLSQTQRQLIAQQLENMKEQWQANYERAQAEKTEEPKVDGQPKTGESLWLEGQPKPELRNAKDYTQMSVKELLVELQSTRSQSSQVNFKILRITSELEQRSEKMLDSEIVATINALLSALMLIEPSSEDALHAHTSLRAVLERLIEEVSQDELVSIIPVLHTTLEQIHGTSSQANMARVTITRILEKLSKKVPLPALASIQNALLLALKLTEGSDIDTSHTRNNIAHCLALVTLRYYQVIHLTDNRLPFISLEKLLSMVSSGPDRISLFPIYGDLEVIGQILQSQDQTNMIQQLNAYREQLMAQYQREQRSGIRGQGTGNSLPDHDPLWTAGVAGGVNAGAGADRAELRNKNYSQMTADELLQALKSVQGTNEASTDTRRALSNALNAAFRRMNQEELPAIFQDSLAAIKEIGESDERTQARDWIAMPLFALIQKIDEDQLAFVFENLIAVLREIKGSSHAAIQVRFSIIQNLILIVHRRHHRSYTSPGDKLAQALHVLFSAASSKVWVFETYGSLHALDQIFESKDDKTIIAKLSAYREQLIALSLREEAPRVKGQEQQDTGGGSGDTDQNDSIWAATVLGPANVSASIKIHSSRSELRMKRRLDPLDQLLNDLKSLKGSGDTTNGIRADLADALTTLGRKLTESQLFLIVDPIITQLEQIEGSRYTANRAKLAITSFINMAASRLSPTQLGGLVKPLFNQIVFKRELEELTSNIPVSFGDSLLEVVREIDQTQLQEVARLLFDYLTNLPDDLEYTNLSLRSICRALTMVFKRIDTFPWSEAVAAFKTLHRNTEQTRTFYPAFPWISDVLAMALLRMHQIEIEKGRDSLFSALSRLLEFHKDDTVLFLRHGDFNEVNSILQSHADRSTKTAQLNHYREQLLALHQREQGAGSREQGTPPHSVGRIRPPAEGIRSQDTDHELWLSGPVGAGAVGVGAAVLNTKSELRTHGDDEYDVMGFESKYWKMDLNELLDELWFILWFNEEGWGKSFDRNTIIEITDHIQRKSKEADQDELVPAARRLFDALEKTVKYFNRDTAAPHLAVARALAAVHWKIHGFNTSEWSNELFLTLEDIFVIAIGEKSLFLSYSSPAAIKQILELKDQNAMIYQLKALREQILAAYQREQGTGDSAAHRRADPSSGGREQEPRDTGSHEPLWTAGVGAGVLLSAKSELRVQFFQIALTKLVDFARQNASLFFRYVINRQKVVERDDDDYEKMSTDELLDDLQFIHLAYAFRHVPPQRRWDISLSLGWRVQKMTKPELLDFSRKLLTILTTTKGSSENAHQIRSAAAGVFKEVVRIIPDTELLAIFKALFSALKITHQSLSVAFSHAARIEERAITDTFEIIRKRMPKADFSQVVDEYLAVLEEIKNRKFLFWEKTIQHQTLHLMGEAVYSFPEAQLRRTAKELIAILRALKDQGGNVNEIRILLLYVFRNIVERLPEADLGGYVTELLSTFDAIKGSNEHAGEAKGDIGHILSKAAERMPPSELPHFADEALIRLESTPNRGNQAYQTTRAMAEALWGFAKAVDPEKADPQKMSKIMNLLLEKLKLIKGKGDNEEWAKIHILLALGAIAKKIPHQELPGLSNAILSELTHYEFNDGLKGRLIDVLIAIADSIDLAELPKISNELLDVLKEMGELNDDEDGGYQTLVTIAVFFEQITPKISETELPRISKAFLTALAAIKGSSYNLDRVRRFVGDVLALISLRINHLPLDNKPLIEQLQKFFSLAPASHSLFPMYGDLNEIGHILKLEDHKQVIAQLNAYQAQLLARYQREQGTPPHSVGRIRPPAEGNREQGTGIRSQDTDHDLWLSGPVGAGIRAELRNKDYSKMTIDELLQALQMGRSDQEAQELKIGIAKVLKESAKTMQPTELQHLSNRLLLLLEAAPAKGRAGRQTIQAVADIYQVIAMKIDPAELPKILEALLTASKLPLKYDVDGRDAKRFITIALTKVAERIPEEKLPTILNYALLELSHYDLDDQLTYSLIFVLDAVANRIQPTELPRILHALLDKLKTIKSLDDKDEEDLIWQVVMIAAFTFKSIAARMSATELPAISKRLLEIRSLAKRDSTQAEKTRDALLAPFPAIAARIDKKELPNLFDQFVDILKNTHRTDASPGSSSNMRLRSRKVLAIIFLRNHQLPLDDETLAKALENLLGIHSPTDSLFPIYGEFSEIDRILRLPGREQMIAQLTIYRKQLIAQSQRDQGTGNREQGTGDGEQGTGIRSQDTESNDTLWVISPAVERSELRTKDYSRMSVDELLNELQSIKGSTIDVNWAREAIADTLTEILKRIDPTKLPAISQALLTALKEIKGFADDANRTRWAITFSFPEILQRIDPTELPAISQALLITLKEIKGLSNATNEARRTITFSFPEILQRIDPTELPAISQALLIALKEIEGSTDAANQARWVIADAFREMPKRIDKSELPAISQTLLAALKEIKGSTIGANQAREAIGKTLAVIVFRHHQIPVTDETNDLLSAL